METDTKRYLRRSTTNSFVAGVAGGLGRYFGVNPFWFRLALVIAFIPGGVPGLATYLILWLIIPLE